MELTIRNFKSFREEVKIKFDSKLNVFFGLNGAGKSNILEVMGFLFSDKEKKYEDFINFESRSDEDNSIYVSCRSKISKENFLIELEYFVKTTLLFGKYEDDDPFIKKLVIPLLNVIIYENENLEYNYSITINSNSKITKSILFNLQNKENIEKKIEDILDKFTFSIGEQNFINHNDKMSNEYYETIHDFFTYDIFTYDFGNAYNFELCQFKNWKYDKKYLISESVECSSEQELKNNSFPLYNLIRLYEKQNKKQILSILPTIQKDHSMSQRLSVEITKYINLKICNIWADFRKWNLNITIRIDDNKIKTWIHNKDETNYRALSKESDGRKHFLSIFFSLFLEDKEDCIYIIDEPEIHLHPESVISLRDEIYKMASKNNLFISTHSIQMLERSRNDYFHVFFDKEKLTSKIEKYNFDKNQIQKMLEDFFGSDSLYYNFMFARRILFVEGVSDMVVMNTFFSFKKIDILVLPTSGASASYIIESYKNILPLDYFLKNIFYLHDNDDGGINNSRKIIEDKVLDENKVINISQLDKSIKNIEDFLSPENKNNFNKEMSDIKKGSGPKVSEIKQKYANIIIEEFQLDKEKKKYKKFTEKIIDKMGYHNE